LLKVAKTKKCFGIKYVIIVDIALRKKNNIIEFFLPKNFESIIKAADNNPKSSKITDKAI